MKGHKAMMKQGLAGLMALSAAGVTQASTPVWTYSTTDITRFFLPASDTRMVTYTVTNQSTVPKRLVLRAQPGVTSNGDCVLAGKGSTCVLVVTIDGSQIPEEGVSGPVLCQMGNPNQCYQPSQEDALKVMRAPGAIGDAFGGGKIACLEGGLNNLIAANEDNSAGIEWGGLATETGATSITDGASNTATIVAVLGNNSGTPYAAQLCNDYQVDSEGNSPCQAGNTCYDDWFLPAGADNDHTAGNQLDCLYENQTAIGGFFSTLYWSSTESSSGPTSSAWFQFFGGGTQLVDSKDSVKRVRCVRALTP